jgi:hypothetical protein
VRRDWWNVADPQGGSTDLSFPEARTFVQQAGLLLAHCLAQREDPMEWVGVQRASLLLGEQLRARPWWARPFQGRHGADLLAPMALQELTSAGLLVADREPDSGWRPTPALQLWQIHVHDQAPGGAASTDLADDTTEEGNQHDDQD